MCITTVIMVLPVNITLHLTLRGKISVLLSSLITRTVNITLLLTVRCRITVLLNSLITKCNLM